MLKEKTKKILDYLFIYIYNEALVPHNFLYKFVKKLNAFYVKITLITQRKHHVFTYKAVVIKAYKINCR